VSDRGPVDVEKIDGDGGRGTKIWGINILEIIGLGKRLSWLLHMPTRLLTTTTLGMSLDNPCPTLLDVSWPWLGLLAQQGDDSFVPEQETIEMYCEVSPHISQDEAPPKEDVWALEKLWISNVKIWNDETVRAKTPWEIVVLTPFHGDVIRGEWSVSLCQVIEVQWANNVKRQCLS